MHAEPRDHMYLAGSNSSAGLRAGLAFSSHSTALMLHARVIGGKEETREASQSGFDLVEAELAPVGALEDSRKADQKVRW